MHHWRRGMDAVAPGYLFTFKHLGYTPTCMLHSIALSRNRRIVDAHTPITLVSTFRATIFGDNIHSLELPETSMLASESA